MEPSIKKKSIENIQCFAELWAYEYTLETLFI